MKGKARFIASLVLAALLPIVSGCGHTQGRAAAPDMETVAERIAETVWAEGPRYYHTDPKEKPVHDEEGWHLASVDYLLERSSNWPAIRHLEYIMAYIRSVGVEGLGKNPSDREAILGLLDYWLDNDYQNEKNWYPNAIGVPYDLADIAVMLQGYLNDSQMEKLSSIVDRGTIGRGIQIDSVGASSNSSDYLNISLRHAVACGDAALLETCSGLVGNLIEIEGQKRTGIQSDLTYFDYSSLASGGSYGGDYAQNIAYFIELLYGTRFKVAEESEKLFIDFLLDGQRFFHRNEGVPQFSLARTTYMGHGGEYIIHALERLIHLDGIYRQDELLDYFNSVQNPSLIVPEVKYFSCPGVLVSNAPSGYLAARGCMDGYSMANVQNQQGVLNYNYSYGSNTCYMYDGDEYSSVGAVYDFSMLPGTTTYYETDDELYARWENDYNQTWGHIDHVSSPESGCDGYTDNSLGGGIVVSELHHDGIHGKNAFITYQGAMYVLGAGFSAEGDGEKHLITTLDQCRADDAELTGGEFAKNALVANGSFVYRNLCGATLKAEKRMQTGSYRRTALNSDAETEKDNVFVCWYDWGTRMDNVAYAYEVSPTDGFREDVIYRIVNNEACQLIEFLDGTVIGYAYEDCVYMNKAGLEISVVARTAALEQYEP